MTEKILSFEPEWIGQPIGLIISRDRQRSLELAHNSTIIMKSTEKPAVNFEEAIKAIVMILDCFFILCDVYLSAQNGLI